MEEIIPDEDRMLIDKYGKDLVNHVKESVAFKTEESSLECPELEANSIFKLLKNRVRLFFFQQEDYRRNGPSKIQQALQAKASINFNFKIGLNKALKKMLREVIVTKDK